MKLRLISSPFVHHGLKSCWSRQVLSDGFIYRARTCNVWNFSLINFSTSKTLFNDKHKNISPEVKPILEKEVKREKVLTVPNALTLTRLVSAPMVGYFITQQKPMVAISIFIYSCVTDLVDGFIARRFNQGSVLGSILDPMADKLLMTVCTLSLAYISAIPLPVASLIIGRDVMLSFMAFYYRYVSLNEPRTLRRFFDLSIPSAKVKPKLISKYNTAIQMVYIGTLVFEPLLKGFFDPELFAVAEFWLQVLVSVTTFLSGASYVVLKDAVVYLNRKLKP